MHTRECRKSPYIYAFALKKHSRSTEPGSYIIPTIFVYSGLHYPVTFTHARRTNAEAMIASALIATPTSVLSAINALALDEEDGDGDADTEGVEV